MSIKIVRYPDYSTNFPLATDRRGIVRYIALVALVKISPTHPHLVSIHHDTILTCVDDPDMSIRLRALDLVEGMVSTSIAIN